MRILENSTNFDVFIDLFVCPAFVYLSSSPEQLVLRQLRWALALLHGMVWSGKMQLRNAQFDQYSLGALLTAKNERFLQQCSTGSRTRMRFRHGRTCPKVQIFNLRLRYFLVYSGDTVPFACVPTTDLILIWSYGCHVFHCFKWRM